MSRKAVLITGGARRVGRALCLHFAQQGYDVALHYYSSKKEAEQVKKAVTALGVRCELFQCDLEDTKSIPGLMKKVRAAMPHCAILINNASVFERAPFMETDEALFDRQTTVNYKAPFFMTQAFAKQFKKGCVVNLLDSDIAQTHGSHFAYLLSKKALAEFTVMSAMALGPAIRVNGVCPGYILPSSEEDRRYIARVEKELPLKKHAQVKDVVEAVYWLSQQKAITGQIIFADGGKHVL